MKTLYNAISTVRYSNVMRVVSFGIILSAALLWSCSSPLDIDTVRKQSTVTASPLTAKYLNVVFEGDDIFGVQDGCELTWYAGITDSIRIDTSGRVTSVHFYANDMKVKNVALGKYTLQSMSIKFDSLACSNLTTSITEGMNGTSGSEMTLKLGQLSIPITADGDKNKVTIAATEHRPARLIQCRFAVELNDPYSSTAPKLNYNVRATIVY